MSRADGALERLGTSRSSAPGFVDACLLGLGGSGRVELKLDRGGGVVLHLVRG